MLIPSHSHRDDNQWGDELTHPDPKGFDPSLEVNFSPFFQKLVFDPSNFGMWRYCNLN